MYGEFLKEYEAGCKMFNKYEHVKAARMLAEYFDGHGISKPTVKDWAAFKKYVKANYYEGTGYIADKDTVYYCLDKAYRFYDCYQMSREQTKTAS